MKICVINSTVFAAGSKRQLDDSHKGHVGRGLAGYGGLEHLAWQTADGLVRKGHQVTFISPQGSELEGGEVISPGPPGGMDERRAYKTYWKELVKFDCIIDESWQKWAYILKAEGVLHAPVLGVLHAPCNTMYQVPPPVDKPCIVCISEDQASHWRALHGNADCRVVRNGIDLEFYRKMDVPRTDRFLFLARFSSIKGPDIAVKAARMADVKLDLVGDTSITQEPQFFEEVSKQCDGDRIRMVGPATRGNTVWWYSQAHCMLHPNQRFREPLGLAPLESQACGTPCIAWKLGAMNETIRHGDTGYLASNIEDYVGCVREFQGKTEHGRQVMRDNCREWTKGFSVQKMIDRYDELCIESVETGGW